MPTIWDCDWATGETFSAQDARLRKAQGLPPEGAAKPLVVLDEAHHTMMNGPRIRQAFGLDKPKGTKQLITIAADGSISGLQMKKGKGLDLRQFGPVSIIRSTEIEWDEKKQKWFVHFLRGEMSGKTLTGTMLVGDETTPVPGIAGIREDGTLLFDDYDTAVAAEVVMIQHFRKAHGRDFV